MKIRRRGGKGFGGAETVFGGTQIQFAKPTGKNLYFQMVDDMCYLDFCLGGLLSLLSTGTRCQGGGSE